MLSHSTCRLESILSMPTQCELSTHPIVAHYTWSHQVHSCRQLNLFEEPTPWLSRLLRLTTLLPSLPCMLLESLSYLRQRAHSGTFFMDQHRSSTTLLGVQSLVCSLEAVKPWLQDAKELLVIHNLILRCQHTPLAEALCTCMHVVGRPFGPDDVMPPTCVLLPSLSSLDLQIFGPVLYGINAAKE